MSNRRSKQKAISSNVAAKEENPFVSYYRFWLPGDAEEPPSLPCEPAELFENLQTSLQLIVAPFGDTPEQRHLDKMLGASMAASKLIRWLAAHSLHGCEAAQGQIADIAREITKEFVYHARKKSPGILSRIKRWPEMPGWLSRSTDCQEEMQQLCRDLNLGEHFPFPLAAKETAKGKVHSIGSAHHFLVDQLHGHIERFRKARKNYWKPLEQDERYAVHPLVLRMANLAPLSPESVKDWIVVSREVLEDATAGNPATHAAFNRGGKYANLGMPPPQSKRAEIVLWKRLAEAWRLRAKEMVRLPEDAPPRK